MSAKNKTDKINILKLSLHGSLIGYLTGFQNGQNILNFADELDSTVAAFQRITKKEKEPGKAWSNYVNLIDRFIYFGGEEK